MAGSAAQRCITLIRERTVATDAKHGYFSGASLESKSSTFEIRPASLAYSGSSSQHSATTGDAGDEKCVSITTELARSVYSKPIDSVRTVVDELLKRRQVLATASTAFAAATAASASMDTSAMFLNDKITKKGQIPHTKMVGPLGKQAKANSSNLPQRRAKG